MKKLIRKYKALVVVAEVIAIVALIDIVFGICINAYLSRHSLPGDYAKIDYLMKEAGEEMLIIGSSTAINAYIPQLIEDSLGITCFNGGCNTQNMPFFQCMIESVLDRYTPKYIILSMRRHELAMRYTGRLNLLDPYYHKGSPSIDYFLEKSNGKKNVLLKSSLYRYNTIIWRIMLYHVKSFNELGEKGFTSHEAPKIPPELIDGSNRTSAYTTLNPVHVKSFLKIVAMCRQAGVELIVDLPPNYVLMPDQGRPYELKAIEELCLKQDIPLINNCQSPFFLSHPELFYDEMHLNRMGSEAYTKLFISEFTDKRRQPFVQ
jgi:hypothetical protein